MTAWITRAETRFGHLAVPGLLRYVAALNALSFILYKLHPNFFEFLVLDRDAVLRGEVWRLATYLFIPRWCWYLPDWIGMAFYVLYLFWIGDGLDQAWGAFRTTLYYLIGMAGTTAAAFIANQDPSGFILNSSLFLAFARFYPEAIIRLYLILPVKVKWLAWIDAALLIFMFSFGNWGIRAATLVAMGNYFLFFGRELIGEARHHRDVSKRRARFERDIREGAPETMHRCTVCGQTEAASPELEFRVAADGEEYCLAHLPKVTS